MKNRFCLCANVPYPGIYGFSPSRTAQKFYISSHFGLMTVLLTGERIPCEGHGLKAAVEEGKIHSQRYQNYVSFYEELKEQEKRRY